MPKSTKLQRYLDLIAYLVGKRIPVPVDELMERVPGYGEGPSARRMFERDKDDLRNAGIPLRVVPYTVDNQDLEGYVIYRRDFYLPYLKLVQSQASTKAEYPDRVRIASVEINDQDAPMALEALRRVATVPSFPLVAEARSAFRKLAFDLDPIAFERESPVFFTETPHDAESAAALRLLSDALLRRKRVTFGYRGIYRGEDTNRDVAGYSLLFQSGQWYFIGHDKLRDAIRVFRVSRMHDVAVNKKSPNTADYDVPNTFKVEDYLGRHAWELGEGEDRPVTARVLFKFPMSLWAERNSHGVAESTREDGSVVRLFAVHQVNPFLRWLLGLQSDVEIVEPAEFKEQLKELALRVATSHREAGDGSD